MPALDELAKGGQARNSQMSTLKCQMKSQCLNGKTYAALLSAAGRGACTPGNAYSGQFGHLIFDIELAFGF
jgi:hypothetical protein